MELLRFLGLFAVVFVVISAAGIGLLMLLAHRYRNVNLRFWEW